MAHSEPHALPASELLGQTDWIRRLARSLVGDAARADDLTQEALLAALKGAPADSEHRRAWLAGVVRNLARLDRRRAARRAARESEVARADRAEDHAALLMEADAHRALVEHVMALDEPHRGTLLQRYFRGRTPAEMAAREGVTVAAISSRLTRAHAALRERLERSGGRDQWHAALTPLLASPVGGARETAAAWKPAGWVLASAGAKVTALAAALAACGVLLVALGGRGGDPELAMPTDGESLDREDPTLAVADEPVAAPADDARRRSTPEPAPTEPATATLRATLTGAASDPIRNAHVRIVGPEGERWISRAEREMEFAALPADVPLTAFAVVDEVATGEPLERFRLEPGEIAERSWQIRTSVTVRGRTVLASGLGAPHQIAQLIRRRTGSGARFADAGNLTDPFARTDEHGEFVIEDVPVGRYWIGAAIDYPLGQRFERTTDADGNPIDLRRSKPKTPPCPLFVPLDIPPESGDVVVTIPVHDELFISGRLLGPDDEPLVDVKLDARRESTDGVLSTSSGLQGVFRIGPLAPGRYSLHCDSSSRDRANAAGWIVENDVVVEAGAENVEVRVLRGAHVRGRVITGRTPFEGILSLVPDERAMDGDRLFLTRTCRVIDGTFDLRALAPGTYTLMYRAMGVPLAVVRKGIVVAPGESIDDLEVRPEPAVNVVLHNRGDRTGTVEIRVGDVLFATVSLEPGNAEEVRVPPGSIEVRGLETLVTPIRGSVDATAGERLLFELRGL